MAYMVCMKTKEQKVRYIIAIENDTVVVVSSYETKPVASLAELQGYMAEQAKRAGVLVDELNVMASSTIDFPEEWTSNKQTIALAKALKAA